MFSDAVVCCCYKGIGHNENVFTTQHMPGKSKAGTYLFVFFLEWYRLTMGLTFKFEKLIFWDLFHLENGDVNFGK